MVPRKTPIEQRLNATIARPVAWGTGIAVAGALSYSVYQTVRWRDRFSAFEDRRDCGSEEENRGGPGCADIYSDVTGARRNAVVGYIAGSLLAAGSAALFLLVPGQDERRVANLSCGVASSLDGGWPISGVI